MQTDEKVALRRAMRELPEPGERLAEGAAAARRLAAWRLFQAARTVGCYASLAREIDTWPVLRMILKAGKTLALPRTRGKGEMDFCRVSDPVFLRPGVWGILEPEEGGEIIPPQEMDLMLIPALAVDIYGHRLGQGGGYYDRYLPQTRCAAAALALSRQVVPAVPCGERDYLVQWIITGKGIVQVQKLSDQA